MCTHKSHVQKRAAEIVATKEAMDNLLDYVANKAMLQRMFNATALEWAAVRLQAKPPWSRPLIKNCTKVPSYYVRLETLAKENL